jgi:hypothetical protein
MPSTGPVPSNACGGFHLAVVNQGPERVAVTVNGTSVGVVDPGMSLMLVEWLPPPLPRMPWRVVIARSSDGAELGRASFEGGEADQQLLVSTQGVERGPLTSSSPGDC